ncbi:MAG TPA: hypothetical protein VEQ61_10020 [Thermoleophilaceae bacterium]|nr:hypothetical protein [Thermoleophilaceae bacterium]
MVRRSLAAAAGLVLLILLVLGVRGCLDARSDRAMKDYVRDVAALMQESDQESKSLFDLLSSGGGQDEAVNIENSLNGFRVQAAGLVDRARDLDPPGDVSDAHRHLVETLELRRDGLARIADELPNAIGDQERREGTRAVAAEMQGLLASDVIYLRRFIPSLAAALKDKQLDDEVRIPRSAFVPDIEWLQPDVVADRLRGVRSGSGGDGEAAPGLHGNGLGTVSVGGTALTPGGAAGTIQLGKDLSFEVQVANQGENTETDVVVKVSVGKGGDAIELEKTLDSIAAGETKTVSIPLGEQPATGQNVPIEVEIEKVPGEKKLDNNKQSYSAIFTS